MKNAINWLQTAWSIKLHSLNHKSRKQQCPSNYQTDQHISANGAPAQGESKQVFLPVHPHPGAQNVTNSAKSVLLAAKAIVSVAATAAERRTSWAGCRGLGHTGPPLPSSDMGLLLFTGNSRLLYVRKKTFKNIIIIKIHKLCRRFWLERDECKVSFKTFKLWKRVKNSCLYIKRLTGSRHFNLF